MNIISYPYCRILQDTALLLQKFIVWVKKYVPPVDFKGSSEHLQLSMSLSAVIVIYRIYRIYNGFLWQP